jgi:DNA-directed RNA polymerase subunit RPC12/RpoP
MELPKIEINLEELANKILDEFEYKGMTIRGWADKITNGEYQPVKYGRWIKGKDWDDWLCSECSNEATLDWKENPILSSFCPNCGAKMELEAKHG